MKYTRFSPAVKRIMKICHKKNEQPLAKNQPDCSNNKKTCYTNNVMLTQMDCLTMFQPTHPRGVRRQPVAVGYLSLLP